MYKVLLIFLFFYLPTNGWVGIYGGSSLDGMRSAIQVTDKGFVMVGGTFSSDFDVPNPNRGGYDVFIVRTDSVGNLLWSDSFGGTGNDIALNAAEAPDHSILVVGWEFSGDGDFSSSHGNGDGFVVKYDSVGNRLWLKLFGGSNYDRLNDIIILDNNNYVIIGDAKSTDGDISLNHGGMDGWIAKIDSLGNILNEKSIGTFYDEYFYNILNEQNNFILFAVNTGNFSFITDNHGFGDYWLVKIDSNFNLIWNRSYGGNADEIPSSISRTTRGYLLTGESTTNSNIPFSTCNSPSGLLITWNIEIDSIGNVLNSRCLRGSDLGASCNSFSPNGVRYVAVTSRSSDFDFNDCNHSNDDITIKTLNSNLFSMDSRCIIGSGQESSGEIISVNDSSLFLFGTTNSTDGDFQNSNPRGGSDFFIMSINPRGPNTDLEEVERILNVYPNPVNDFINIDTDREDLIQIYNSFGQKVYSGYEHKINFISNCSGIYYLFLGNLKKLIYKV